MTRILAITATALMLAGCASGPGSDKSAVPRSARIVSKDVGPLLIAAQAMTQAGNWNGAMAKIDEAEAVKSNPDDAYVINQMRHYIEVRSSQPSQP